MKDSNRATKTSEGETLRPEEQRIIHTIVAKAFVNRKGHGGTEGVVHRQMTRIELASLLAEAMKKEERFLRLRRGEIS